MNRKHLWLWLIVFAYTYFIFSNSMKVADASNEMSYALTYKLMALLERINIIVEFHPFHHLVRKTAHFVEFAGLGILLTLAIHFAPLFKPKILNFVLFLVVIPFTDEMIQNFYAGRSAQFSDMLLDGAGILFGGAITYLFILIIQKLFSKKV